MRKRAAKRAVKHACLDEAWHAFARVALAFALLGTLLATPWSASRVGAQSLEAQVQSTLRGLYETTPAAGQLARTAKGILVFPEIGRDNYVFGLLQSGSGALLVNGRVVSYYEISSVVYGMQAGVLSSRPRSSRCRMIHCDASITAAAGRSARMGAWWSWPRALARCRKAR